MTSDPDPPPSDLSDSSSSDSEKKRKKRKDKKKRRKHRKDDSSDPSSSDDSDDSDSSEDSDYKHRRRKNKKHREKDPIILCATLTAKLLTTAFISKTIRFKLDEDPLQRRIYFLTFIDSLNMVFSQYRENYEVLRDYPKLEGGNIKDYAKQAIRNLLHVNSSVHSRRLIAEFPDDGIRCIQKLQSHCADMTFADKSRYDRTFQQVTHKGGESAINYIKRFQNAQALSVSVGNSYSEDQIMHTFLDNFQQSGNIQPS